jgi:beta-galactosidase
LGVNAYRCSHNPPTPEFLDACDRLGLLVLDENRLMGPSPEQLGQLESMIRRDRNHPSVILWSLGNEEWAIEGNIKGARITASMQAFAHRLDPTRRTTWPTAAAGAASRR